MSRSVLLSSVDFACVYATLSYLYTKNILVLKQEIVSKVHTFSISVIVFNITSESQVGFVIMDFSVQNIQINVH